MPDVEVECRFCGESFVYSTAEQQADESKTYPPPRACGPCLRQRRAVGAAKRAAKRPAWRQFRR